MPLSGTEVLKLYLNQGWVIIHRKGSHVKIGKGPLRKTIPVHKELGVGLQRMLLKKVGRNHKGLRRESVTYHFRIHSGAIPWAECVELEGCVTQGRNRRELERNMKEALDLYLEEPETSTMIFPQPLAGIAGRNLVPVEVDPAVAFSVHLRQLRIANRLTQKEAARRLGMKSLFSYQRLERRSNPSLSTLRKVRGLFPGFSLDMILGG